MSSGDIVFVAVVWAVVAVVLVFLVRKIVANFKRDRAINVASKTGPGSVEVSDDPWRRFTCALAGMYARSEAPMGKIYPGTFLGYGVAMAPTAVAAALRRNWDVSDHSDAHDQIAKGLEVVVAQTASVLGGDRASVTSAAELVQPTGAPKGAVERLSDAIAADGDGDPASAAALAFDIGRLANLVRWSACVSFIDTPTAHDASDTLGLCASLVFEDWNDYGTRYLEGLDASGFGGRRPFHKAVDWLLSAPDTPWAPDLWPPRR